MLDIKGLSTGYGKKKILRDVALSIREKETHLLVGPNGAGKSTMLRTIIGVHKVWEGHIVYNGQDITGEKAYNIVSKGVRLVPEGKGTFSNLRVQDNLGFGAKVLKTSVKKRPSISKVYDLFPVLEKRKNQVAGTLSGGERQMLSIGIALASEPKLLLLDEPTLGLAPKLIDTMFDALRELIRDGLTMLLVEQNVRKAAKIADKLEVMRLGEIVHRGNPNSIDIDQLWDFF